MTCQCDACPALPVVHLPSNLIKTPENETNLNMLPLIIGLDAGYRGSVLEAQLRTQGIEPLRVPGVLLEDLPGADHMYADQAVARILLRRNLTAGEIGCALAHRGAYRRLLSSSADFALVFEDDARLQDELPMEEIRSHMASSSPRVILLDWNPGWTIVSGRKPPKSSSVYSTSLAPIDARAYVLNRAAAELLMQNESPINYVADWPAQVSGRIGFSITYPRPVRADWNVPSTLEEDRQSQGITQLDRKWKKALRIVATISHVRWFSHRRAYGNYGVYWQHELVRLPVYALARKLNRRLDASDTSSPLVFPVPGSKSEPRPVKTIRSARIFKAKTRDASHTTVAGLETKGDK